MDCSNCYGTGYVHTSNFDGACFFCNGSGTMCDQCGEPSEEECNVCSDCISGEEEGQ